jgi:hypothetical protein
MINDSEELLELPCGRKPFGQCGDLVVGTGLAQSVQEPSLAGAPDGHEDDMEDATGSTSRWGAPQLRCE